MEDKRKAYKGIKFLKVDNQFLGAQLRKSSSKALSINGNMPFVNKNFSSIRSSENSVSKSVIKSSLIKSSRNYVSKSLIKSTFIFKILLLIYYYLYQFSLHYLYC